MNPKAKSFLFVGIMVMLVVGLSVGSAFAQSQQIIVVPSTTTPAPESSFTTSITYNVSTGDNTLTGIGFSIHYNSTILQYNGFSDFFTFGKLSDPLDQADSTNEDGDANTDRLVRFSYARAFDGDWPNQTLPLELATLSFTLKSGVAVGTSTDLNVAFKTLATGFTGAGTDATVTVTPKALVSIAISSPQNTVAVGDGLQFTATGTYDDDSTDNITSSATWSVTTSSPSGAAEFDTATAGQLNGLKQGTATVRASSSGIDSATSDVTITAFAGTIGVAANPSTLVANGVTNSTITATVQVNGNAAVDNVPVNFSVTSGAGTVSTSSFTAGGTATATYTSSTAVGTETVSASIGQVSGSADITLTAGPAAKIQLVSSKSQLVTNGLDSATLTATILDAFDNTVTTYATAIALTVTPTTLATLAGGGSTDATPTNGVATATLNSVDAGTEGSIQLLASSGALTPDTLTIQGITKVLSSITIEIVAGGDVATASPKVGEDVQFKATGHYNLPGQAVDPALDEVITTQVTWNSSDPAKGTLNANGLFSALVEGSTNVTATMSGVTSNTVAMSVQPPAAVSIDTASLPTTMQAGGTVDIGAVTSGGTGAGFTYTIDSQPAGNAGLITAGGVFSVNEALPFAGTYVIKATDSKSGAFASYTVKVPMKLQPTSFSMLETAAPETLTLTGAAAGTVFTVTFLDTAGAALADTTGYGTFSAGDGGSPLEKFTYTPDNVTEIKSFKAQFAASDASLQTAGLDKVISGIYRVIPIKTYVGQITDVGNAGIGGATVQVLAPAEYAQVTTTLSVADGTLPIGGFSFDLPATGTGYQLMASKNGYISRTFTSANLASDTPETNAIALTQAGTDAYISGTVLQVGGGAAFTAAQATVTALYDNAGSLVSDGEAKTNQANGTFRLDFAADNSPYTLVASAPGFYAETAVAGPLPVTNVSLTFSALAADTVNATAGGSTALTQVAGQNVYVVNIPAGHVDTSQGATSVAVAVTGTTNPAGSAFTAGSGTTVFSITAVDQGGNPASFTDYIIVTIPFDLSVVSPGGFESGAYIIYHAPSVDDLLNGTNLSVVSPADIVAADYVGDGSTGTVSFKVRSLSAFGVAAASPSAAAEEEDDSDGACFISSSASGGSHGRSLGMLMAAVLAATLLMRFARARRSR